MKMTDALRIETIRLDYLPESDQCLVDIKACTVDSVADMLGCLTEELIKKRILTPKDVRTISQHAIREAQKEKEGGK